MEKRMILAAAAVLILAAACATHKPIAPETTPAPVSLTSPTVATVAENTPPLGADSGGIVQRWITHTTTDFERLGVVAKDEPIGAACSVKGLALMSALPSASAPPTGYFLTDTESARLAQRSNIVALARAAAQACTPLVIGPEKFWGALGVPKAVQDILSGGGGQ